MILMDKGYFDYDFEKVDKADVPVDWNDTVKSEEQVWDILSGFGPWAHRSKSVEEIQEHIIKQMKED